MDPFRTYASAWLDLPHADLPGTVVAIGDLHGYVEHLDALVRALTPLFAQMRAERGAALVTIGDYIHRGPASLATLTRTAGLAAELDLPVHHLCGNHDRMLLDLLRDPGFDRDALRFWLGQGGNGLLRELGLDPLAIVARGVAAVREQVMARLPQAVPAFLDDLVRAVRLGDWLFVHGGVDPLLPLERQDHLAWLSLREPFLTGVGWRHAFRVVHGHTVRQPGLLPHRVAIDSGCYRTGALTAVELRPGRLRFVTVTDAADLNGLRALRCDGFCPPLEPVGTLPLD
jgi:serine/threonine protein phosphatase 1